MCGLTGTLALRGDLGEDAAAVGHAMGLAIQHRGPDSHDVWVDREAGVMLGHRRLAIIDLSVQGAQPMRSACGRYVIVYNGELYNHLELRAQLPSHTWRGGSDTETLLACFSTWGVVASLERLVGMFAFAVWDRSERCVILARDRMGEKPLVHTTLQRGADAQLVFASDVSALRRHPWWQGRIDRNALAAYMRLACVPAPHGIFEAVHKLMPGQWKRFGVDGSVQEGRYWDLDRLAHQGTAQRRQPMDDAKAIDALERTLGDAVASQMLADVPLGAFLSGGVDSSCIVALMQARSPRPVRTFTIGFDVPGFNEAEHARAVARHLGTEHTELVVTAQQALDAVPRLASIYDEPFADSSQIPTLLVAQMARQHVTVALSGDGADELFGGYNRYLVAHRWWPRLARMPLRLRQGLAHTIRNTPPATLDRRVARAARFVPRLGGYSAVGLKLHKLAEGVLAQPDLAEVHRHLVSAWRHPNELVLGAREPTLRPWPGGELGPIEAMSLLDQSLYMPDDILVKVDRAAMGVSLETRAPFLDHRVVSLSWGLPASQKIRNGRSKWLLRQLLDRHVPASLIDRPKQGFAMPVAAWLRGPLRSWAEDLLADDTLRQQGLLDARLVRTAWQEHLQGDRDWHAQLWNVLMFQNWWRHTQGCASPPMTP